MNPWSRIICFTSLASMHSMYLNFTACSYNTLDLSILPFPLTTGCTPCPAVETLQLPLCSTSSPAWTTSSFKSSTKKTSVESWDWRVAWSQRPWISIMADNTELVRHCLAPTHNWTLISSNVRFPADSTVSRTASELIRLQSFVQMKETNQILSTPFFLLSMKLSYLRFSQFFFFFPNSQWRG